jgi:hypothetical protein
VWCGEPGNTPLAAACLWTGGWLADDWLTGWLFAPRRCHGTGTVTSAFPDGTSLVQRSDGTREQVHPDGTVLTSSGPGGDTVVRPSPEAAAAAARGAREQAAAAAAAAAAAPVVRGQQQGRTLGGGGGGSLQQGKENLLEWCRLATEPYQPRVNVTG